jgi:hypothetical protein
MCFPAYPSFSVIFIMFCYPLFTFISWKGRKEKKENGKPLIGGNQQQAQQSNDDDADD